MNRNSLAISLAIVLGCLILALVPGRPSVGQPPVPQPSMVGRYQVSVSSAGGGALVVVCDTQTGHCWGNSGVGNVWSDLRGPVPLK
jgi:hypothetical protein